MEGEEGRKRGGGRVSSEYVCVRAHSTRVGFVSRVQVCGWIGQVRDPAGRQAGRQSGRHAGTFFLFLTNERQV